MQRVHVTIFSLLATAAVAVPLAAQPIRNQCSPQGNACQTVQNGACFNIHKDLTVSGTAGGTISFYNDGFQLLGFGLHAQGMPVDQKGTAVGVRGETTVVPTGQPQDGSASGDLGFSSGFFAQGHFDGARGFSSPLVLENFNNTMTSTATGGFFRSDGGTGLQLDGVGTYWMAGSYNEIRGTVNGNPGMGQVAAVVGVDNLDPTSTSRHYAGFFDGLMRITTMPNDNTLTDVVVADGQGVLHLRDAATLGTLDLDWDISSNPPHMFSLPAGNVGIGTPSPTEKLDVRGRARIRSLPLNNALTQVVVADSAGVLHTRDAGTIGGGADLDWQVSGPNMWSLPADNVGIGTTTPSGKLHVRQNVSAFGGIQYAARIHTSSTTINDHRIGLEIQNTGSPAGGRDDVGLWVRRVDGSPFPSNNMAAVLNGNVAIGHLSVGNQEIGTGGSYVLSMKDGTPPSTNPSAYQGIQLWSQNGELRVRDAFSNVTTLSPHNFSMVEASEPMAWSYYSENPALNQKIAVDMLRLTRVVEKISGETLAHVQDLDDDTVHAAGAGDPAAGEIVQLRSELRGANQRIEQLEQRLAELAAALEQPTL